MSYLLVGFTTVATFAGAVGGVAIQEHRYVTNDTKNAIEVAGYFNDLRDKGFIKQGDLLTVAGDRDGTPFVQDYVFSTVPASGNVIVTGAAVTSGVTQEIFIPKISNKAADAEVFRYVPNFAGTITKMRTVLNAALATGDATLTLKIGATAVTNGVATVTQAGSAAGDVDIATPTALNSFVAGDVISVTAGGASTATSTNNISLQLTPT